MNDFNLNTEATFIFPIFTCCEFVVYMGALRVGQTFTNPLGGDDNAFELVAFFNRNLRLAHLYGCYGPPDKFEIKHNSAFGTLYTSDDEETKPVLYTDSDDIPEGYKVGDTKEGASKLVGDVKKVKSQVKSVKYSVLYMKALKALQESMIRIETLETKVKALEDA